MIQGLFLHDAILGSLALCLPLQLHETSHASDRPVLLRTASLRLPERSLRTEQFAHAEPGNARPNMAASRN